MYGASAFAWKRVPLVPRRRSAHSHAETEVPTGGTAPIDRRRLIRRYHARLDYRHLVRATEASARLKQLLREREVQLGDGDHAPETALLAWELFCVAASEPADTPFEYYGAMTRVAEHEDADLLLFEAGAYTSSANGRRYALSFSRQFSLESDDDDYVGMNGVSLAIDFDGDHLDTWAVDQLWGYAGHRRHDVSDVQHPEIANWGGHVSSWALQLRNGPAFRAFAQLRPVRIIVEQSDI